jgi:uncharacterized protein (TIGR02391 family)
MTAPKKFEFSKRLPTIESGILEAIARTIGDTTEGFNGQDIGRFLKECDLIDSDPLNTKWKRIYNSFVLFQNEHQVSNHVIRFINHVMKPSLHLKNVPRFHWMKDHLNVALGLCGYRVDESGVVRTTNKVTTLSDAKARSASLRMKLEERKAHAEVFRFCDEQLLENNYFHAVLEAVKSITSRIRSISGLSGDGSELIDGALSSVKGIDPIIKINAYDTDTKKGEQRGFINLLKGLYGTFRNPLSHEAKIEWEITEEDALDILSLISLIHRKLDKI